MCWGGYLATRELGIRPRRCRAEQELTPDFAIERKEWWRSEGVVEGDLRKSRKNWVCDEGDGDSKIEREGVAAIEVRCVQISKKDGRSDTGR